MMVYAFSCRLACRSHCRLACRTTVLDNNRMSQLDVATARTYSIEKTVELIQKSHELPNYKKTRKLYCSNVLWVSKSRRVHKQIRFTKCEKEKWIYDLLPQSIELSSGILYKITVLGIRGFWELIKLRRWGIISIFVGFIVLYPLAFSYVHRIENSHSDGL